MPIDEVVRRYADRLFQNSLEEIVEKKQAEIAAVRADHFKRNMISSGAYIAAHGKVLVDQIRLLGAARADSLLRAYEKAGLSFDDGALNEIKSEVMQFCHQQQHSAVGSIGQTISQSFGGQLPQVQDAVGKEITGGVTAIMSRLARDLSIRRDEVMLEESKVRKAYGAGLGKKWDVFVCHASEDKESFVRPLAMLLQESGLLVWYDEFTLKIGDSLRRKLMRVLQIRATASLS